MVLGVLSAAAEEVLEVVVDICLCFVRDGLLRWRQLGAVGQEARGAQEAQDLFVAQGVVVEEVFLESEFLHEGLGEVLVPERGADDFVAPHYVAEEALACVGRKFQNGG